MRSPCFVYARLLIPFGHREIYSREIEWFLIDNTRTMTNTYPICHKEDISESGSKGFSLEARLGEIDFFVVRKKITILPM